MGARLLACKRVAPDRHDPFATPALSARGELGHYAASSFGERSELPTDMAIGWVWVRTVMFGTGVVGVVDLPSTCCWREAKTSPNRGFLNDREAAIWLKAQSGARMATSARLPDRYVIRCINNEITIILEYSSNRTLVLGVAGPSNAPVRAIVHDVAVPLEDQGTITGKVRHPHLQVSCATEKIRTTTWIKRNGWGAIPDCLRIDQNDVAVVLQCHMSSVPLILTGEARVVGQPRTPPERIIEKRAKLDIQLHRHLVSQWNG
ncbi:hypothetical protein C4K29_2097 [Pseudomonas chlororaphis subsp. piscium]|nr:hypothetical protein C4K29_2097 [Pseudomonas chlororaphis subsp. piscium]